MIEQIAGQLSLRNQQVHAVLTLINDGATVPFIARYRKESTGSLDEVKIRSIRDLHTKLSELHARKQSILSSLEERDLLTAELEDSINSATTMSQVEDLYLPFRPKRKNTSIHGEGKRPGTIGTSHF